MTSVSVSSFSFHKQFPATSSRRSGHTYHSPFEASARGSVRGQGPGGGARASVRGAPGVFGGQGAGGPGVVYGMFSQKTGEEGRRREWRGVRRRKSLKRPVKERKQNCGHKKGEVREEKRIEGRVEGRSEGAKKGGEGKGDAHLCSNIRR